MSTQTTLEKAMAKHETTIHVRCPFNELWNYYKVRVITSNFIRCEDVETAADTVRGETLTQEEATARLKKELQQAAAIETEGFHGQNCKLTVTA